ncbi:MAG TPA: hypothetical protein VL947_14025, partial [Cytophagales bacterium]|nr:hypothetical protein [Cytophagales bacterium]
DYQRYKIFVTPFDIFVFKIAGKQEYVNGHEGDKFINSVKINSLSHAGNKTFTPPHGGYSVKLKFHPQVFYDYYTGKSSLKYSDTVNGLHTIIEHYYSFNNDYLSDSSVLKLCEESLNRSPDFEKEVYRKIEETANGYTLDLIDSCKNKKYRSAKFVLSWPHIYVLVSVGGLKILNDNYVHDSFKITEFKSGEEALFVDTLAQFKVKTTSEITLDHHYMKLRKDMEALARDEHYVPYVKNHNEAFELKDPLSGYSVGIFVEQLSKYYYSSAPNFGIDTLEYTKGKRSPLVLKASGEAPSGHKYFYYTFNYYGSLITAHVKYIVTNEKIYVLKAYTLKGSELGPYCKKIFDTFEPHFNHKRNLNPFVKNTRVFWRDYFSANSKTFKTFQENLREQVYDLEDLDSLYKAYRRIGYKEEKYFKYKSDILEEISTVGNYRSNVNFQPANYLIDEYKNSYYSKGSNEDDENYLLERRSDMHFNKLIADEKAQNKKLELLVRMYKEAGDTLNLQRSVLEAISKLKTKEALHYVKNLLLEDPLITSNRYGESLAGIFNPMSDTLSLSKQLFPDIMQLTSISEEYKTEIIDLVEDLVKYQKIKPKELKKMHGLVFEATLQFKKQKLNDEKVLIAKNIVNREDVYSYNNKTDKFSLNTSLSDLLGTVAYLYKVDEKATKLVDKMLLSPNKVLKSELVAELLSKDKPVSDSIIVNLATDEYYSYTFYNKLRVRRLTHKFPHERTSQRKMTEIMLKNNLNVYDSIVFLDKQYVEIAGKTGYVYIYKYRIKRLDDWKLIVLGIQPKNLEQVNISEYLNEVYPKPLKHDSQSSSFSSEILHKKKIMTLKAGFYNDKEGYSHGGFNYVDYED